MNALTSHAFERVFSDRGHPPRGLEVGAGTGGTTAYLVDVLERTPGDYVFSDVSTFFLNAARMKFAGTPGMSFALLNLDAAPEDQGFQVRKFDVIVAANMLHACRSVRESLRHLSHILRPNGILLLLETTRPMRWLDLVFGLTDGWWAFADSRLRTDYPLLSTSQWLSVLPDTGFKRSYAVENVPSNQSLFVCRAD